MLDAYKRASVVAFQYRYLMVIAKKATIKEIKANQQKKKASIKWQCQKNWLFRRESLFQLNLSHHSSLFSSSPLFLLSDKNRSELLVKHTVWPLIFTEF